MRDKLPRINWFLSTQAGIDLRRIFFFPQGLIRYAKAYLKFKRMGAGPLRLMPCLHDWREEAGTTRTEYFWQDLLVAQMIHEADPKTHVDVGSRLDGFVAHVASFRDIEVFDIRALSLKIPRVTFRQVDMMSSNSGREHYADSVSCLHAIEHFGLGRYGDPMRLDGFHLGIRNLSRLLTPDGTLYLSCPVGADEIYFNAHRAARPNTIAAIARDNGLTLDKCWLFSPTSSSFEGPFSSALLDEAASRGNYTLALFTFRNAAPAV